VSIGPKRALTLTLVALAILGIALRARTFTGLGPEALCGADFPIFYAGGQLAGTPQLYSAAAVRAIELRETGCTQPPALFVRLPYFAGLMMPWARLPFGLSFLLWRLALVMSAVVFLWLWPAPRAWSLLACAWSLPFAYGLTIGQDSGFLLLWLALAVALLARGYQFAAGLALSMCAAKFHLFLLLPLLLIGRRRVAYGGALGGVLMLAACFAVQGPHWFGQFLGAIGDPTINPDPSEFLNLWGMAHGNTAIELLLDIPVVAAVVYVTRRADLHLGLAASLAGGLLISHHQTPSDLVLLVPIALVLATNPQVRYAKVLAAFLATPLAYFLMRSPGLWEVPRALLFLMVLLLAWDVRPRNQQLVPSAAPAAA
jgi:Glycosyltransferase family 87